MGAVSKAVLDDDEVIQALDDLALQYESSISVSTLIEAVEIAEGRSVVPPTREHLQALLEWQGGTASLKQSAPF